MSELRQLWYIPSVQAFFMWAPQARPPAGEVCARDAFGASIHVELAALKPFECSSAAALALISPHLARLNDETLALASALFLAPDDTSYEEDDALLKLTTAALLERCATSPVQTAQSLRDLARLYTQRAMASWMRGESAAPTPLTLQLSELGEALEAIATTLERAARSSALSQLLARVPWLGPRRAPAARVRAQLQRVFPSLMMELQLVSRDAALRRRVSEALSPLSFSFPPLP